MQSCTSPFLAVSLLILHMYLNGQPINPSPPQPPLYIFHLYLSLVRKLTYCSQLRRPYLIKDIISLERVQRTATKFVLNDSSNYKARLISLKLLPLMYWFELQDILFLVKCMKEPAENFDISTYVSFINQIPENQVPQNCDIPLARSQLLSTFTSGESYIYGTPSLPLTFQIHSHQSSVVSSNTYGTISSSISILTPHPPFTLFVLVLPALTFHDLNLC